MRDSMVTRTIIGTKVSVMVVNTESGTTNVQDVTIGNRFKDEAAMLKAIAKAYDTDINKVVKIVSAEPVETRYGMKEADFIAHATILPPLAKKNK